MDKILKLGAEARLTLEGNQVIKRRIKKGYRLPEIDKKLRTTRTQREASLMQRAMRAKINVPRILKVDKENAVIVMEYINGKRIDEILNKNLAKKLGREVAKLHAAGIIHGDLTTSNILVKENKIYFIDFGLGEFSESIEKRAVDLRVLKEAIIANHPKDADTFVNLILKEYEKSYESGNDVIERLKKVEQRGRYKKR